LIGGSWRSTLTAPTPEASELQRPIHDVTHEFCAFELDANIKVDFDRDLFTQPELSPLLPCLLGFQFAARSDEDAFDQMQAAIDKVVKHENVYNAVPGWARLFSGAIASGQPQRRHSLSFARLSVEIRRVTENGKFSSVRICTKAPPFLIGVFQGLILRTKFSVYRSSAGCGLESSYASREGICDVRFP
jgi:hypothetical protein